MYSSIVVGTDGSPTAARAVEAASRLALDHGATLHIVSAYTDPETARQRGLGLGAAEVALAEAKAAAALVGVDAQTHVLGGEPGERIAGIAAELGADLIVVGNRLLGGMQGYFMGSVPAKVLRMAPCSVLVVRTSEPSQSGSG